MCLLPIAPQAETAPGSTVFARVRTPARRGHSLQLEQAPGAQSERPPLFSLQGSGGVSRDSKLAARPPATHCGADTRLKPGLAPRALRRSTIVEERFKSALDVLKETLHVPLARISIAEGGARALWFNTGGPGAGDGERTPPPPSAWQLQSRWWCRDEGLWMATQASVQPEAVCRLTSGPPQLPFPPPLPMRKSWS